MKKYSPPRSTLNVSKILGLAMVLLAVRFDGLDISLEKSASSRKFALNPCSVFSGTSG